MGDFNEPVTGDPIKTMFDSVHMHEGIINHHPEQQPPNTFRHGTNTIDGMFLSKPLRVVNSGYTATDWGLLTDHRLLWIDLDTSQLFHPSDIPYWKPGSRRLTLQDPRVVNRFTQERNNLARTHNLLPALKALQSSLRDRVISPNDALNTLNQLDDTRTTDILTADHLCRKLKMGNIPWSPDLHICLARIQYFKRVITSSDTRSKTHSRTLKTLQTKAQLANATTDISDAKTELHSHFQQFFIIKKNAAARRTTFLEELAAAKATTNNSQYLSTLKQLRDRERLRYTFRRINKAIGKPRVGLSIIESTGADGTPITITDKIEIEQACIIENIHRFTQAANTPSLLPDQVTLLGWTATSSTSADILNAIKPPRHNELHKDIQDILPQLASPINPMPSISHEISCNDMLYFWKRNKEFTATGKSGLHYGHFRASCNDQLLLQIDKTFLEISLEFGLILDRWLNVVDVMIPKKANSYKVDKLRTIMLFECDWNLLNKIIAKRTMAQAEKLNTIAPEQYGSRKHKSSILHACNKQLLFDIIRQKKLTVILIILDAKGCYDCVAIPFASLSLLRQGVTPPMIKIMFATLSQMKHYIRTAFGNSNTYYTQTDIPFHGIGQGNGAGPMIWVMVSTPILESLRDNNFGINLSTNNAKSHQLVAFTFVDDNDMVQEIKAGDSGIDPAQRALNLWNKGLRTSGGSCAPEKSSWSSISYLWKGNKWKLQEAPPSSQALYMENDKQERIPLPFVSPSGATLALGIMFSPSGQMQSQFLHLQTKCKSWAQAINRSRLTKHETFTAMTTTIWKTVEYSLLATTLSLAQCSNIAGVILMAGLPRAGICRYIDRRPLFSCCKYQGFGLKHPYFIQGLKKLEFILDTHDATSAILIHEALTLTALISGLGTNFFQYNLPNLIKILDNSWVRSLWEFSLHAGLVLKMKSELELRHKKDKFIMELLGQQYKGTTLLTLNYCRLYLKVDLLSDIFNLNMTKVAPHIWKGHVQQCSNDNRPWPHQPRPTTAAWKLWRQSLQEVLSLDNYGKSCINTHVTAFVPIRWQWFWDLSCSRIYETNNEGHCQIWTRLAQRQSRSSKFTKSNLQVTPLPSTAIPCTVQIHSNTTISLHSYINEAATITNVNPTNTPNLGNFINDTTHGDTTFLRTALSTSTLLIATDGSYLGPFSTGAWIITTCTSYPNHYTSGHVQTPGLGPDQDSHRAELIAILGALLSMNKHCHQLSIAEGTVTFGADNKSAIRYAFDIDTYPYVHSKMPDFDIIRSIRKSMIPGITHKWKHVKSHQDRQHGPLDLWATLNVFADSHAGHSRTLAIQDLTPFWLPHEHIAVYIDDQKLCKHFASHIHEHYSKPNMIQYWNKKRHHRPSAFSSVDWNAIETAGHEVPKHKLRWITKHSTGICGVNEMLHKWKKRDNDLCPRCGQSETSTHVWQCIGKDSLLIWTQALDRLQTWLESVNTSPSIIHAIRSNLLNWVSNQTMPNPRSELETAQDLLGWEYLLEGSLSTAWAATQQLYFIHIGKKNSGHRWVVELIKKLWEIAWDIWTYRNGIAADSNQDILTTTINEQVDTALQTATPLQISVQPHLYPMSYSATDTAPSKHANNSSKRSWLTAIKAHQQYLQANKRRRTELNSMQQNMANFLKRGHTQK